MLKNILLWFGITAALTLLFDYYSSSSSSEALDYSAFVRQVQSGQVRRVSIDNVKIEGEYNDGARFVTVRPPLDDDALMSDLLNHHVIIQGKEPERQSLFTQLLVAAFPFLIIFGIFMLFARQLQSGLGGRGGPMSFGRSRAKLLSDDQPRTTFADVAGVDEAKDDVQELVEFLRDPARFQKIGGRIPRGVLMVGAPGTGKTLLARAISGEAQVPFFSISGSDFVEMFVGVGASRVRDMFEQAKKQSPCIIFIDEIDAVGRHRGAGLGGGHDEREQTLNQLLVEMDGFNAHDGVIVIAATNRPDVLDPALLRPGRFDRQVVVSLPDIRGREQILKVHMRKVPLADGVQTGMLARGTPGFSGADLANLVNEAALLAARSRAPHVGMLDFERAKDKILMGAERRSMVMSEDDRRNTAYHEAGHAIVGRLSPEHDPVYKISIIPRGRALGVTMFLPEEDRYSKSRRSIISQVSSLFGGRIAEELVMGEDAVTTGASNDIKRATELVRNMVTRWGLSELGPMAYDEEEEEVFLGRSAASSPRQVSNDTSREIDRQVRRIIDECYARAKTLLQDNMDILHAMAAALMQHETLDSEQISDLMARRPVRESEPPPSDWSAAPEAAPETDKTASDDSLTTGSDGSDEIGPGVPDPMHRNAD